MRAPQYFLIALFSLPAGVGAEPIAIPDSLAAHEDSELATTVSILDNDTSDGPDLSASLLTTTSHGVLALDADGTFTYIPDPQFHGSDEFTYIARETDDRPVEFIVDQSLSEVDFTATINDPDFGSRTDDDASKITGTVVAQLDPARGALDDVRVIDFSFTLADGAKLSFNYGFFVGSLNVEVPNNGLVIEMETPGPRSSVDPENRFSQPDNDVKITGSADISASGTIGLIFEDTSIDIDAVEMIDIENATVIDDGGTLVLTIPITFDSSIPVDDTRSVDVTLEGQIIATAPVPPLPADSDPATVTITVAATNDGPLASNDSFTTPVGQPLTRDSANGLLTNDRDLDLDPLTATLVTPPANGSVTVEQNGSFTYIPRAGFSGQDTFSYSVSDSNPPASVPILAAGSLWRFLDDGSDQGTAWSANDFDDSTWLTGQAELGYGETGQSTTISFGDDPDNKNITAYFRSSFDIKDPATIAALELYILRDDAAAVYINGTEVYRDPGLPAAAAFDTTATISTGGADESTFFPFFASPDLLVPGENSIAVEVHQSSGTSSDLSFDLEIFAVLPTPSPLIVAGSDWRYLDDGSDQRSAWRASDFDDSLWKVGPARLGYGEPQIDTIVDFGDDDDGKHRTTYFRHSFTIDDSSGIQAAQIKILADDGAAVFLNGTEIGRVRLGPDADFDSLATSTAGNLDEHRFTQFVVPPQLLTTGVNTVAAEVHQSSGRSSDLSFDLELLASFAPALATATVQVIGDPGVDSDNDGMLDDYEITFGLTVGIDDSAEDPDADGRTNLEESIAGTNPLDPSSSLAVSTTSFDGASFTVVFQSVPGKSYRLQSSEDLVVWFDVAGSTVIASSTESAISYDAPDDLRATSVRVVTP